MSDHLLFALIAFVCDLYASTRYFLSIRAGRTRPHVFSWIVCAITAGIAAAISYLGGAILTGILLTVASIINILIVFTSLKSGTRYITRVDYWAFVGALIAIPLWIITKEPLYAAICISAISFLGEAPTIRKAWRLPFEENGEMYFLFALISLGRLMATQPLTWATGFYPSVGVLVQMTTVCVVFAQRYRMRKVVKS